jgi:hypothetical protein
LLRDVVDSKNKVIRKKNKYFSFYLEHHIVAVSVCVCERERLSLCVLFILAEKARARGQRCKGAGVVRDKGLKLVDVKVSHM